MARKVVQKRDGTDEHTLRRLVANDPFHLSLTPADGRARLHHWLGVGLFLRLSRACVPDRVVVFTALDDRHFRSQRHHGFRGRRTRRLRILQRGDRLLECLYLSAYLARDRLCSFPVAADSDRPAESARRAGHSARTTGSFHRRDQEIAERPPDCLRLDKQIKVGEKWMTPDEFLTTQLHLSLTHGISPSAFREMADKAHRAA